MEADKEDIALELEAKESVISDLEKRLGVQSQELEEQRQTISQLQAAVARQRISLEKKSEKERASAEEMKSLLAKEEETRAAKEQVEIKFQTYRNRAHTALKQAKGMSPEEWEEQKNQFEDMKNKVREHEEAMIQEQEKRAVLAKEMERVKDRLQISERQREALARSEEQLCKKLGEMDASVVPPTPNQDEREHLLQLQALYLGSDLYKNATPGKEEGRMDVSEGWDDNDDDWGVEEEIFDKSKSPAEKTFEEFAQAFKDGLAYAEKQHQTIKDLKCAVQCLGEKVSTLQSKPSKSPTTDISMEKYQDALDQAELLGEELERADNSIIMLQQQLKETSRNDETRG